MEQWPNMFRILNLYRKCDDLKRVVNNHRRVFQVAAREQGAETSEDADTPGERLVRVPIDEVPDSGRTR